MVSGSRAGLGGWRGGWVHISGWVARVGMHRLHSFGFRGPPQTGAREPPELGLNNLIWVAWHGKPRWDRAKAGTSPKYLPVGKVFIDAGKSTETDISEGTGFGFVSECRTVHT